MRNFALKFVLFVPFLFMVVGIQLAGFIPQAMAATGGHTRETMLELPPLQAAQMGEGVMEFIVADEFHGQVKLTWSEFDAMIAQDNGAYRQVSPLQALEAAAVEGESQVLTALGIDPATAPDQIVDAGARVLALWLAGNSDYVLADGEMDTLAFYLAGDDPVLTQVFHTSFATAVETI